MRQVFKNICVDSGAILMFYHGVVVYTLKQVAQIWHSVTKAIKNYISLRAFLIKSTFFE